MYVFRFGPVYSFLRFSKSEQNLRIFLIVNFIILQPMWIKLNKLRRNMKTNNVFLEIQISTCFTVNTPPSKTDFSFLEGGGILKFFTGLFLKGGGILRKILRKNAKCGGACGGLLIIVPSAQALLKRESFIRCATSWQCYSSISVYILIIYYGLYPQNV